MTPVLLSAFLSNVFEPVKLVGRSADCVAQYRGALRWLAVALQREPTTDDLNAANMQLMLDAMAAAGVGGTWQSKVRQRIAALWMYAYKLKLVETYEPIATGPVSAKPLPSAAPADSLTAHLQRYFLARPLAAPTEYRMGRALRVFVGWLEREPTPADLTDELVSEWVRDMAEVYAPKSCKEFRADLLALWRWLAGQKLCLAPADVRKIKLGDPCPIAWTEQEAAAILAQCRLLTGKLPTGVPRATYCEALFRFCYDTGLRRSDVWTITRDQIRADGTIVLRQHKTGHMHWPRLRPETLQLLEQLSGDPPLACPYGTSSRWYKFWRECVTTPAGVRHGALQQTRRTGATHLATVHPEAVQRFLGHRTPEMQRHYIDWSIAKPQSHLPPNILGPDVGHVMPSLTDCRRDENPGRRSAS